MTKHISGGRFIAETLKGYRVDHVFLIMAILRRGMVEIEDVGIKRILVHSEKTAAYMADGYARVSGKPGVCLAQSVGAANLAAGLQDAFLAHSPVIAITGRKPPLFQYRNAYQEICHGPMFDYVTKYNVNVDTVEQLPYLLGQAFREAVTGAPRPVHLDLLGLAGEVVELSEAELPMVFEQAYTRYPAFRIEPDPALIREAAKLVDGAQCPVIVAGGGAVASSAQSAVADFAERFSIPVASSCDGKGVVPDTHPLNAGVVGSYSAKCANQIVSESDLVIYVGSAVGDQVTHNWKIPKEGTQVIQIDINPSELGRNYRSTLGILGDAQVTVKKLHQEMGNAETKESWAAHARQLVERWRQEVEPLRTSKAVPIRPERLCKELTEVLPRNAIVVSDTGYSAIWSATMLDLTHPDQRYIRAAGSLGWAFPASLGAKCGAPDRPVVCFTGDGALWYHIADLETAKRWGINTVTVVNNNSGYGQSQVGVKRAYGKSSGEAGHLFRFEPVNFARIAEEIGCLGIRVESPEDVAGAVRQALASNQPAVVDVATDDDSIAADPWEPGIE